jgi:microcystin-dependent protein
MLPNQSLPVGVVLPYAGPLANSENTTTGPVPVNIAQIRANLASVGWLFCDGASLSIATYRQLYGVIGTAFGGDASNFCLPDLRGRFVRGVSGTFANGEVRDPDIASRTASTAGGNAANLVGSLQSDAFQGHEHNYNGISAAAPPTLGPGDAPTDGVIAQVTSSEVTQAPDGDPRVSSETRPLNLSLNYIIRYC